MDLVLNQDVVINNKELKTITTEIRKSAANVIGNTYKIAALIAHVNKTELYLEDGFVDTFDYVKQCFGLEKASAYNLIKIGEDFIAGEGNKYNTLLTHGDKDYSISQVIKMLPLGIDKAKELTADGVIDETMSCRQIEKIVKENTEGTKARGKTKTEPDPEPEDVDEDENEDEVAVCKWDELPDVIKTFFLEYFNIEDFSEIREISIY